MLAATVLFYWLQPKLATFPVDGARWVRQAAIVAVTSTLALGIHYETIRQLRLPEGGEMLAWLLP